VHKFDVGAKALNPGGRWVATGGQDDAIQVQEVHSGGVVRSFKGHAVAGTSQPVNAVTYGPDGQSLASGGNDGSLRLRDAQSGRPKAAFETGRGGQYRLQPSLKATARRPGR
jgi:WD40 repeat protein